MDLERRPHTNLDAALELIRGLSAVSAVLTGSTIAMHVYFKGVDAIESPILKAAAMVPLLAVFAWFMADFFIESRSGDKRSEPKPAEAKPAHSTQCSPWRAALASGKRVPVFTYSCGSCQNEWFTLGYSKEYVGDFCPYCGIKHDNFVFVDESHSSEA